MPSSRTTSGALAARIAAAGDARVKALVLGGTEVPGHHPWVIEMYGARLARLPFTGHVVQTLMRLRFVRTSAIGFGGVFKDPDYAEGEFGRLFVLLRSEAAMKAALQLIRTLDFTIVDGLPDVRRRIEAPARLSWGTEDPFLPIDLARSVVGQFAGEPDLVEIAGAKFLAQEDHPDTFASHALRFLERHVAPTAS